MKNSVFLLLAITTICIACNSSVNKIFGKKTPHETYAGKVDGSPEGRQWVTVSETVLATPQSISLPYRHVGQFPAGRPRALALKFTVKQGERINFDLVKDKGSSFVIYADLFKQDGIGVSHLLAADTSGSQFGFDADETGEYILRLQPELNFDGKYKFSASIAPSLGFPVVGTKARTGSFWGDDRDGGQRRHEGIDIFAPKLTPAIAAANGYITRVSEGGIGGKTIWMKAKDRNISLYYAHLDKQLVETGQAVKKGDTLGLVGNTGNAMHTPSHLHFGVYGRSGAIDPLPFVNKTIREAPAFKHKDPGGHLKLKSSVAKKSVTKVEELLVPLAVTDKGYIVELPDGNIMQAPFSSVVQIKGAGLPANAVTGKAIQELSSGIANP